MNWIKIWELSKNPTVQRWLLSIALICCIFFWTRSCSNYNDELNRKDNNFDAYKDTIKKVLTKNGQLEYEKMLLSTNADELKKYSDSLKIELDKEKKGVQVIWKEKIVYRDITVYVDSSKYKKLNDSTYIIDWEFQSKQNSVYKSLKGNSIFEIDATPNRNLHKLFSHLTESIFCIDVVTGIKEDDKGRYNIFVRTKENNPNVTFEQIEGAIVDPAMFSKKQDRFIIGPYLGFGYSNNFGFSAGIGITYKLWGF